ncbi:MAG TPA: hypothetical protein VLF71_03595 [Candidatus Saccharimonadales bacterium]|nr:hypothetical protein [Candidatus Saccharimonadales bacterium]
MFKVSRLRVVQVALLVLTVAGLLTATLWGNKGVRAEYQVNFTNMWVGRVTPGYGYIGVDTWWPNSSGGIYNPCQNSSDPFYGACILSNSGQTSYYKVQHFTPNGTDFPYGIFIDNQNQNNCKTASWCTNKNASTFTHGWGRLVTDASIEIYPIYSNGQYNAALSSIGGVRIQTNFPSFANGGRYSNNIGDIALPAIGQPNVGKLNGFVTYKGGPVTNNRFLFEAFQEQSTYGTSTQYPVTGFSVTSSNSDGYYNLGALPDGTYKIYITDTQNHNHKIILQNVSVRSTGERLDFQVEQGCFGHISPDCTDPAN